ncbi:MAG: MBL fold metallo-hydrolase [Lachnospiraceae bacterium]
MKIKYINHSCFLIEMSSTYFLFDYTEGTLPEIPQNARLFIFVSHFHADHFSLKIFSLADCCNDVHFILANDIKRRFNRKFFLSHGVSEAAYEKIQFLSANTSLSLEDVNIETLRSTDSGVAFCIHFDGETIYHAGDLNLWDDTPEMRRGFFDAMQKIQGKHVSVAFLPLDPHLGKPFFAEGFDYFMKHTSTDLVFPMHYWGDSTVIDWIRLWENAASYSMRIAAPEDFF